MRHETGKDETLRSNSVYSVLVDKEGLIWVGFYQLGLDYTLYQSGLFSTYTYAPFLIPEICQYVHLLSKRKKN